MNDPYKRILIATLKDNEYITYATNRIQTMNNGDHTETNSNSDYKDIDQAQINDVGTICSRRNKILRTEEISYHLYDNKYTLIAFSIFILND
jgi:hypothetical protein